MRRSAVLRSWFGRVQGPARPARPAEGAAAGTGARLLAGVAALLLAVATGAVFAPMASATLPSTGVGPVDPDTHFPAYYTDSTGLAVQLCLDGLPNCLTARDELLDPNLGGDGEAFYYAADAALEPFAVHLALEAAYAGPGADQEVVFMRTQVSSRGGLTPGATYSVTDPYGEFRCTASSTGTIANNACRTETTPTPLDFTAATGGRLGPFLTWDTFGAPAGAPPAGYIGDNVTEHAVIGSPTGFNAVQISGPGLSGTCTLGPVDIPNCVETDQFVIQGKVAPGVAASTSLNTVDFGNIPATPVTRTITYRNIGTADIAVTSVDIGGTNANAFSRTENCTTVPAPGLAPGASCTIDVTFTPQPGLSSTATLTITDTTPVQTRSIPLTGSNLGHPLVSPGSLSFPDTPVGATSVADNVAVGNDGVGPVSVTVAVVGTSGQHFAIPPNGNGCTAAIAPDAGCEIAVVFQPTSTGVENLASLRLTFSTGETVNVALSGRGIAPAATVSPTALAYGDQVLGTVSAVQTVTLTNQTAAALPVSAIGLGGTDPTQFARSGGTCTAGGSVPAGGSCTVSATFGPTTAGAKTASLAITAGGVTYGVPLSGTGTVTVPGAPTIGMPSAGNASATVRWTAPSANGGSAVTGYQVRSYVGAATTPFSTTPAGAAATSVMVTGLTNGTAYAFDVVATNAVGSGAASSRSVAVTPSADLTAPTVTGRSPAAGAVAVAVTTNVTATFSEVVQGVSGTTFTLRTAAGATVGGAVTFNATTRVATLDPTLNLAADTRYTATLTGGTAAIRDGANNPLATTSWTFTTGPRPTVTTRSPASGAVGVSRVANATATFSEPVLGVSGTTFTLRNATTGALISAVVSRNGTTNQWILNPNVTLAANTRFTVTLTGGTTAIRDAAGNPLSRTSWSFTTGP